MRIRRSWLAIVFGLGGWWAAADEPSPAVARLIAQLGSPQYAERTAASRALAVLGTQAVQPLRQAAAGPDAEVRRRARALLRQIEQDQETAALLKPRVVRLRYRETPLADAVADLVTQTGLPLQLTDRAKRLDRTVTLDTGEVPVWQAFDQFCAAAGLADRVTPAPPKRRSGGTLVTQVIIVNGNVITSRSSSSSGDDGDGRILLEDAGGAGKSKPRPGTHYAGALRVRVLPGSAAAGLNESAREGETLLALEVLADPALRWQRALGIRLRQAEDDQGQSLDQVLPLPPPPTTVSGNRSVIIVNGNVLSDDDSDRSDPRLTALRLRNREKPGRALREVSGVVSGVLQTPPLPLLDVPNVTEATGKAVTGRHGSSLKVLKVTTTDEGHLELRVQVESPPLDVGDGTLANLGGTFWAGGRMLGVPADDAGDVNFALLDARGRPFQTVEVDPSVARAGVPREYRLVFHPKEKTGPPERLILTGRRAAVVDVPFTFKDVPLP